MIHILNQFSSSASDALQTVRDRNLQLNSLLFRDRLSYIGMILGYEISKSLSTVQRDVETVLGRSTAPVPSSQVTLVSILRAGVPMHQGLLCSFPDAQSGFIGSMRTYDENNSVAIDSSYRALPIVHNRYVIVADPMIATGGSIRDAISKVRDSGTPEKIFVASVIAHRRTLETLAHESRDVEFWTCGVDEELNEHAYIVPGLGDAGDLAFGQKV